MKQEGAMAIFGIVFLGLLSFLSYGPHLPTWMWVVALAMFAVIGWQLLDLVARAEKREEEEAARKRQSS